MNVDVRTCGIYGVFCIIMKKSDYINIQGWMVSELKLNGNELLLFAIIHGFSKDGNNKYRGSISYVSEFLSLSKKTVINLYKKLLEKKYIAKENCNTGNYYYVLVHQGSVKITPVNKVHQGSVKSTPVSSVKSSHNINNNINNINYKSLLDFINKTQCRTGKNVFKVINGSVKSKYKARLKDGYTKEDIINAIVNTSKNDYHKKNNYQYLTPEFFSRSSTLDKYSFSSQTETDTRTDMEVINDGVFKNF